MLFVHLLSRCDEREAVVLIGLNPGFVDRVDRRKKAIGHGDVGVPANRGGDRPSVRRRCGGGMSVLGPFEGSWRVDESREVQRGAERRDCVPPAADRKGTPRPRDEGGGSPRRGHATVWKLHAG